MNVTVRNYRNGNDLRIPTEGLVALAATNTPQALSAAGSPVRFSKLWLYPALALPGAAGGPPTANAQTIWCGKSAVNQPDALAPTQVVNGVNVPGAPVCYACPLGECMDLRHVYIYGTIGDGVLYSYT